MRALQRSLDSREHPHDCSFREREDVEDAPYVGWDTRRGSPSKARPASTRTSWRESFARPEWCRLSMAPPTETPSHSAGDGRTDFQTVGFSDLAGSACRLQMVSGRRRRSSSSRHDLRKSLDH